MSQIDSEDMKNRIRVTKKYINNLVMSIEEGLGIEGGLEGDLATQVIAHDNENHPEPAVTPQNPNALPTSSIPTL